MDGETFYGRHKTFENRLLWKRMADDLETWCMYATFGTQVLPNLSK